MIEGLKVDVKSEELVKILTERMQHHLERSEAYNKKAAELKATLSGLEEDLSVGKVSNNSASGGLETKAREHKDKSTYYKFLLDHVIQNDTYRLDQADLERLGVSVRYF